VADDVSQTPDQKAPALVKVYPELRDQRIGDSKLGQGEPGNSKLADAEHPRSKLRDSHHAAGKLTDGDYPFGGYWHSVGTILEAHM
jgi:hypothetical protein